MKKVLFSVILGFVSMALFSQNNNQVKYRKAITFDLFGGGILANLSFDMRLKKGVQDGLGFKAGIGGLSLVNATVVDENGNRGLGDLGIITLPIEVNYLIGKRRSAFETGVGLLSVYGTASGNIANNSTSATESFSYKGFSTGTVFLKMGYRFQPMNNGLTFNIAYTPLINSKGFQHWIGLGVGFSFK